MKARGRRRPVGLRFFVWLTLLFGLAAGSCGGAAELSSPDLHAGADVCHRCGMMVGDARFVGALVWRDDRGHVSKVLFDDIGEMLLEEAPPGEHVFYAHSFDGEGWIDARTATFLHSSEIMTPMATGVLAFAGRAAAEQFSLSRTGVVVSFDEARRLAHDDALGVAATATAP